MPRSKENPNASASQRTPLEVENLALREEVKQLRAENTAAQAKLKEQQALEKRYQESQSRFEAIFDQSMLGNKIIAPDLKIIQVNKALQQMMGYTKAELIGNRITKFAHPDFVHDWQVLQENLWGKQIPSFQLETCLLKKDGAVIWCLVTSIIFPDQGISLGFTIIQDINQRKSLELDLKKLYDNQETIMHMVAHDLKSPIHIIKLSAGFLKEKLNITDGDEQSAQDGNLDFLNIITDTCDKSITIIEDLLIIGKLEASSDLWEQTDLKSFVQSQVKILAVDAWKKDIQVNWHLPAESVYARINQDKFTRVLDNLISNALKFTNQGGQIDIFLKENDQTVILQVSDTGIGIPENLKATIFDKFNKSGRTGTAGETTTGLGLYIVKQIVEKHKGKIWVESQEKVGTTFFIELPV